MKIFHISYTTIKQRLLQFLQAQLLVSITALPILVQWGLPMSYATIVGNLIFMPFIMAFLFLSSFIFFFELMHIPNTLFIYPLELLTKSWLWTSAFGSPHWLFSIPKAHAPLLFLAPLIAAIALCNTQCNAAARRVFVLTLILFLTGIAGKLISHEQPNIINIPCSKGTVTVINDKQKTVVIDPGYCARITNPASWIEYTLLPTLNKTFGTTTIDYYLALQPGARTLEALATACSNATVHKIYLPIWKGTLSKRSYRHFRNTVDSSRTIITRVDHDIIQEVVSEQTHISITPLQQTIKSSSLTYPGYRVSYCCGNQEGCIYSSKYRHTI